MLKFFVKIFSIIILAAVCGQNVLAYSNPGQPTGFVNDYAALFSANEKTALEEKLVSFEKESSNEISVVTIASLDGDTIENFAVKLFADWGIGKKDNDNGVLILVARDDRQMRIEVGYGLEGALTDAQSFWIIKNIMTPKFQAGDFYGGIDGAVDKIISATQGEYVPETTNSETSGDVWESIIGFGIFFFIFLASILGRSKSWWAGGVLGGIAGIIIGLIKGFVLLGIISLVILIPAGLLFDFIVSKQYQAGKKRGHIPWWIGGSGRGGGSGFGGGFGGFGGGMSGGGGASGRW